MDYSLSQPLLDVGNVYGLITFGIGGGFILYILTVLVEYLILNQHYRFVQEKQFRYVAAVNAISAIIGIILYFIARELFTIGLLTLVFTFLLTLIIETAVWILLLKMPKKMYKTIFIYSFIANCASYLLLPIVLFLGSTALAFL
ncbi:MAG: hypothetical protein V2J07_07655 [Anaerolineae bacterium]|jgi:hypothetical protein|nr:hypothetical protein [Anaerolineae bacterium]